MDPDTDESYHEYLWGEASPRSFARKARIAGARSRVSRNVIEVSVDPEATVDVSRYV